jgi:hypothetical protein
MKKNKYMLCLGYKYRIDLKLLESWKFWKFFLLIKILKIEHDFNESHSENLFVYRDSSFF